MVCVGGSESGATRPNEASNYRASSRKKVYAFLGAAAAGLCIFASLAGQTAIVSDDTVSLESKEKGKSQNSPEDIQNQLLKAKELFDGAPSVPSLPTHGSSLPGRSPRGGAPTSAGRGRTELGLKGMSQQEFEREVDGAVTRKVAQVLLKTMRPLKHVLYEQQKKIEELRHEKSREVAAEQRIAARISDNLKKGLLTHLKSDVDLEVKRVLTPKDLLRAEKSKQALRKKLAHAKAVKTKAAEKAKQSDVRSAVKNSMNKALNGVYEAEKKAKEADKKRAAAAHHGSSSSSSSSSTSSSSSSSASAASSSSSKKNCDPLAGLYKSGIVSWC